MEEQVLNVAEGLYRWPGPKRKQTLFSATVGRVILTSERFLFLSTGKHDVTAGKLLAGAAGNISSGLKTTRTEHLDLSALENKGSLEIPLRNIKGCELKSMFKYLVVHYVDDAGAEASTAIAPKNGGMPAGPTWIAQIDEAQGRLST